MAIENVGIPFKNRLSLKFVNEGDWLMNHDFFIKDHFSTESKIFDPLSLNITNLRDLMEEVTPSIYYMMSWLEESLKNKRSVYLEYKNVEGAHPSLTPDDCINFYIRIYSFKKFPNCTTRWYWNKHISKTIVNVKFKSNDLTNGENILMKIKTHIIEELKKQSCELNTAFIKIEINYLILHPLDVGERMMKAHYVERDRYR